MTSDAPRGKAPFAASSLLLRLRGVIDALTLGLNVVGTLLIVALMVLVCADVIGREAFGTPISGVPEMVSMSIVVIVFLQVAQAFRMGRLTRAEAILNIAARKSPRLRAAMEAVFAITALFILFQMFSASVPLFEKAWVRNTFEGTIGDFTAPIWPVKLVILIGCVMLMIQLVITAVVACASVASGSALPQGDADGSV